MGSVPTIDLGLLPHESEPDLADPGSLPSWWRRVGTRRPALAALVAVLVGLLGAAAAPAQPRLARLWTVPATAMDQLVLAGTTLYVVATVADGVRVRAYRVADGTLRWEAPVDSSGGWASLTLAGEVPLVSAPGPGGEEFVTAHDPDTGQARWRHRGWPYAILTGDRVVLTRPLPDAWPVDDGSWPGDGRHPYEVALVDLHSGEVAWSQRLRVGELVLSTQAEAPGELGHLLTLTREGRLSRYDPNSGAVLASVDTPSTDDGWDRHGVVTISRSVVVPYAQVRRDEVVLPEPDGLASYDAVTLAPRWRLSLPGRRWAVPCARLVCAFTESGSSGRLEAIEPETGRIRWSRACGEELPGRRACVLFPRAPAPEGQLLVEGLSLADDHASQVTWALGVATGDMFTQLSQWHLLGPADRDRWLFVRSAGPQRPNQPHQQLWLARWAGGPGRLEVLGVIDAGWCHPPAGDHLVCMPAEAGNAEVWRVR